MPPKAIRRGLRAAMRSDTAAEPRDDQANSAQNESVAAGSRASSSARPPVQRLQSLNRRAPGGSIPYRASSARDELGQPKPALKFQPRASTRRNKEEREALEKLEAERNRERAREAMEIQKARRSPGMGSRGAFGGRGGTASGSMRRGRGGRMDDSRASSASRHSIARSFTATASASAGDISSDESDSAVRVSIDNINLNDDDDDDGNDLDMLAIEKVKGKKAVKHARISKNRGLRPVRVERHEHEERVVGVNTEASSSTSAELRRQAHEIEDADDSVFVVGDGTDETGPRIKAEPTDGNVAMGDIPHTTVQETTEDTETPLPAQAVRARKRVSVRDPRSLLRTKEEIEEYDRHLKDLELMKELLSIDERPATEKPTTSTDDRDTTAEAGGGVELTETTDEDAVAEDRHAGQLFLVQFPPLTPNLIGPDPISQTVEHHSDAGEDVQITHVGIRPEGPSLKQENGEEVEEGKPPVHPPSTSTFVTATQQQLPAGRVGRLRLHASGRVTMDWGGISFELNKGTEVDFLQEALVATTPSSPVPGADKTEEKKVWAMGQLSGKFVAQPDWSQLL